MNESGNKIGYITSINVGSGFFTNYFYMLGFIYDAVNMGLKPYVNLNNTAFIEDFNPYDKNGQLYSEDTFMNHLPKDPPNTWEWWFEQDALKDDDIIINIPNNYSFNQRDKLWNRPDIPRFKQIANEYIHIKPHILNQIDNYYDSFLKNHIVLSVMARGCEMNLTHPEYGNQTIETYMRGTSETLKAHPEIDLIFLVTEDSNYIPIFLNKFPNTQYLKNVFRRTTETIEYMNRYKFWPNLSSSRKNHRRLLGEECLVQTLLLSKCDYLVAKQCGTSSAAIFYANENLKDVIYI